jgi:predicted secreted protein with PEFG-CTERM motif
VPNPDRTFSEEFIIDERFGLNGTYSVEVDSGGLYSSTKSFVVPEFGSIVMIIFGISFAMILINKSVFRPLTNLNF